jgi:hypothetical protein
VVKLNSTPGFPTNLTANGIPVNMCMNRTPEGKLQIAKVLKPGGPQEGEFEILWEGDTQWEADAFFRQQVEKDFPGLMSQRD